MKCSFLKTIFLELKAKVQELTERSSTKQQKEKSKDHLAQLVENMEAKTESKSDSSILNGKEVETEEKTVKKRGNKRSR